MHTMLLPHIASSDAPATTAITKATFLPTPTILPKLDGLEDAETSLAQEKAII